MHTLLLLAVSRDIAVETGNNKRLKYEPLQLSQQRQLSSHKTRLVELKILLLIYLMYYYLIFVKFSKSVGIIAVTSCASVNLIASGKVFIYILCDQVSIYFPNFSSILISISSSFWVIFQYLLWQRLIGSYIFKICLFYHHWKQLQH